MPEPKPPIAPRRAHTVTVHGIELSDDYHWLRERDDPEVTAYLDAENLYTDAMMAHTAPLQDGLFAEMRARMQETDTSAWDRLDDRFYYDRTVEGLQYAIHCRRTGSLDAAEEVLLDENEIAQAHDYFELGVLEVSPDHRLLAYSSDTDGSEQFTAVVRDLSTGALLDDRLENTTYSLAWANDNRTFFYTVLDEARRPYKVFRHVLGTVQRDDVEIFHEPDERFGIYLGRSPSRRFIFMGVGSSVTSEWYAFDADAPEAEPRLIARRRPGVEYDVIDQGGRWLIRTNDGAKNFRLLEAPIDAPGETSELVPARDEVKITGVTALADHLILSERTGGLTHLRVHRVSTGEQHTIEVPEQVYVVFPGANHNVDTTVFRFGYSSPVTPMSWFDYDLVTRERTLIKQHPVPGYDSSRFVAERIWARAPDGVEVPITIARRRDVPLDGTAPALLRGYGSYGISEEPVFSPSRLCLLERGVVVATGHVRGGGELGEPWRDDGKLERKRNTFTDFIACAEHLVARGYAARDRLAIMGGSAGGLLMGAVTNMRPDLFTAVVALVPFVDVINTMLDKSLPLTVGEFEEWGNPGDEEQAFRTMRSYSPYDNLEAKDYPHILVVSSINDPRVQYWEPAKYVAKLRTLKTDDNVLLLRMRMEQGHSGPSGRYDALRDDAFVYSFLLDRLGVADLTPAPAGRA